MAAFIVFVFSICILFNIFINVLAATHWIVTEDGRIQAQIDSIFQMKRPYDLVALMKQEERFRMINTLHIELFNHKEEIDRNEDKEVNLEQKYYGFDVNCMSAGKPLTDFDLYTTTALPLENKNIWINDYIDGSIPKPDAVIPPDCTKIIPLDFSIHSFEHLQGMMDRKNLTSTEESGLKNAISPQMEIDDFGYLVNVALNKNKTSWVLYNMAAFYWRIKGNAYNAVECLRRALHYSTRQQKDVALISLANILHQAHYSEDAAIVTHTSLDISQDLDINHFTLGNIYAVLMDYNESLICFENVLRLQPDFEAAQLRRHAILCHMKLEKALENQHKSLQRTLSELKDYQKKHEFLLQQQEKLLSEQLPFDDKIKQQLFYQELKQLTSDEETSQQCFTFERGSGSSKIVSCPLGDTETLRSTLEKMHLEQEYSTKEIIRPRPNMTIDENQLPRKNMLVHLQPEWPSREECNELLQRPLEQITTFLTAEKRGFNVKSYLLDGLGLKMGEEHELPWTPPVCVTLFPLGNNEMEFDHIPSVFNRETTGIRRADATMAPVLLSYVNDGDVSQEEVGQRIQSAIRQDVGPKWILFNLAGLYWRVIGNNYHAIECMRRSLYLAPSDHLDIPIVNLASLLITLGHLNDALTIMEQAIKINGEESISHSLIGSLMASLGNYTGAIFHFEKVLDLNPADSDVLTRLHHIKCLLKFSNKTSKMKQGMQSFNKIDKTSELITKKFVVKKVSNDKNTLSDDGLSEILLPVVPSSSPPTLAECLGLRPVSLQLFTTTILSISAKAISVTDYLDVKSPLPSQVMEPLCSEDFPATAHTLDHLKGVAECSSLDYSPELGLKEAFQTLAGGSQTVATMATRIAFAMQKNTTSWILTTLAAIYWRIQGRAVQAVNCLRQALHLAPRSMKDIPLISLANIFHKAKLFNDAIVITNMALEISPHVVVIHFTMANIYAAKGDMERAKIFYESTLTLQPTFQPAKDRLHTIHCNTILHQQEKPSKS